MARLIDTRSVSGGSSVPVVSSTILTGNTTLTSASSNQTIKVDSSGGAFTITLPSAATLGAGNYFTFKDYVGYCGAKAISLATVLPQTIDGLTTYSMNVSYISLTIQSDGSNYLVI